MLRIFSTFSKTLLTTLFFLIPRKEARPQTKTYTWRNVEMGGGDFVSGIITSKTAENLMYARTDVGGAYPLGCREFTLDSIVRLDLRERAWKSGGSVSCH